MNGSRTKLSEEDPLPPEDRRGLPLHDRSLEWLYKRQSPRLFRMFMRRTACRDEAHDMVQDIFSRLAGSNAGQIDRPEAYLTRMARNLLINRRRTAEIRPQSIAYEPEHGADFSDPVRLLETRDTLHRLERAMARLKPRTRDIFLAHRLHGLNYAQIAEKTGLSIKGVEKQMSKAIAEIDRMLDKG